MKKFLLLTAVVLATTFTSCQKDEIERLEGEISGLEAQIVDLTGQVAQTTLDLGTANYLLAAANEGLELNYQELIAATDLISELEAAIAESLAENAEAHIAIADLEARIDEVIGDALRAVAEEKAKLVKSIKDGYLFLYNPNNLIDGFGEVLILNDDKTGTIGTGFNLYTADDDTLIKSFEGFVWRAGSNN